MMKVKLIENTGSLYFNQFIGRVVDVVYFVPGSGDVEVAIPDMYGKPTSYWSVGEYEILPEDEAEAQPCEKQAGVTQNNAFTFGLIELEESLTLKLEAFRSEYEDSEDSLLDLEERIELLEIERALETSRSVDIRKNVVDLERTIDKIKNIKNTVLDLIYREVI